MSTKNEDWNNDEDSLGSTIHKSFEDSNVEKETLLDPRFFISETRAGSWLRQLALHVFNATIVSLVWGLVFLTFSHRVPICKDNSKGTLITCGNSSVEAIALGCEFDPLSVTWLPKQCIDRDLTNEFLAMGPWPGYTDDKGTALVSDEDKARGTLHYTTLMEHAAHCAIELRKVHKAIKTGGKRIDSLELSYHHTIHCTELLLYLSKKAPAEILNKLQTPNRAGFGDCYV
ncbi:hypothetical protein F5884DRAFT_827982 [Xylogone sp. PMI_703]|nr:hypothetical protein F5884DRAFT_827982 [Xylogone sp. PMI_703]